MNVVDNSNTYGFNPRNSKADPNNLGLPPDVAGKLLTGQYPNGVTFASPSGEPQVNPRLRTTMVDREFRNPEVLSALQSLTKQSFGYDKDQWAPLVGGTHHHGRVQASDVARPSVALSRPVYSSAGCRSCRVTGPSRLAKRPHNNFPACVRPECRESPLEPEKRQMNRPAIQRRLPGPPHLQP